MPSSVIKIALLAAVAAPLFTAPSSAAPAPPADAVPFSVQDMVRLERLSDVAVAPDGKHVAFTQRSTDLEANKGRTSVFVLDTSKRNASPQRLTDSADNSSAAEWSQDGRYVYYLTNRGGSTQVWRATLSGETLQVTKLPLDVGSFRVSPKADRLLITAEVFLDCADLACTKQRLDAASHAKATGVLHHSRISAGHYHVLLPDW